MGPVEVLVVEFPGNKFKGEIVPALREYEFESIGKGLLIGIIIFVPIFAYIQSFTQLHMDEFMKVLQGL